MTEQLVRRSLDIDDVVPFAVRVRFDDPVHVVELSGDLDLATRDAAIRVCTPSDHRCTVVDLSNLVFMDCAGYRALATARSILEQRGDSMVVRNAVGEPKRLLALIDDLCAGRRIVRPFGTAGRSTYPTAAV